MFTYKEVTITRYLHSGFRLDTDGLKVYIDPYKIPDDQPPADIIFITHDHFDHCDELSLSKLLQRWTSIVGNEAVMTKIAPSVSFEKFIKTQPGDHVEVSGIEVDTVAAYNINKFREQGVPFHPKEAAGMGYIIHLGNTTVYHMGDTDNIPELASISGVDVALVPVSGTYVMTPEEASEAVSTFKPKVAIPMHYGADVVGSAEDARKFASLVPKDVQVEII